MTDCGSWVKRIWATPYFLLKRTLLEVPDWVLYVLMESSSPAVTSRSSLLWKSKELMRAALSYRTLETMISPCTDVSSFCWCSASRQLIAVRTLNTRPTPKDLTTSSLICISLHTMLIKYQIVAVHSSDLAPALY